MDFTAPLKKQILTEETVDIGMSAHQITVMPKMEAIKQTFAPYLNQIKEMVTQAQAHEVIDEETNKQAVAMAGEAKRLAKKITAEGERIVGEPNQFVKSVRGLCKDFTAPLAEIETNLKQKFGPYQSKIELDRREQERRAQEAARELQKQLDAEAKEKGVESITVITPVIKKEDKVTRTSTGASAFIKRPWKAEILDESQVPREYCSPDMRLINQGVRMGVREILGVRIFQDIQTNIRA
ncbi:MAG: hypothetical protein KKE53_07180 [Proteobacteria bacterium]|nr:hypothetical protein [Pseudomonadota bacterium]